MARARGSELRRVGAGERTVPVRGGSRSDQLRLLRDRTRIAQAAARLIVEHGISDWSLAKRKAARQLMLPATVALPSNDDIAQALADHHTLFGGEAHAVSLRGQRIEALAWMHRLERWDPVLVGGVAAGWATEHSDVRLELVADDPKGVEMALASEGVAYSAAAPVEGPERSPGATELRIATGRSGVRLTILTPALRRNRRRDDEPRLTATALAALIAG
jgi:hypothetical protein